MPDQITRLLDQIDRLDREATQGPWTWGDNRDGLGNKLHPTAFPGKYNPIADFEYTNDEDAEFIALARTVLPKLAEAVYHVLELLEVTEKSNKYAYEFGGNKSPSLVTTNEVRKAITDALERELSTG